MSETIYPRSPRERMAGWVHLPRFVDKIRLHAANRLPPDYQSSFCNGFDAFWLKAAGLTAESFLPVVKSTITDGEVCDWVTQNVKAASEEKQRFNDFILNRGRNDDCQEKLERRKADAGMKNRDDIQCMVDFIDADEGRPIG